MGLIILFYSSQNVKRTTVTNEANLLVAFLDIKDKICNKN